MPLRGRERVSAHSNLRHDGRVAKGGKNWRQPALRPLWDLLTRYLFSRRRVIQEKPFNDGKRQTAVLDQVVVELADAKVRAGFLAITSEQIHDLPFPDDITDLLSRARCRAGRFASRCLAIETAGFHEILDRLFETPFSGVQVHIRSEERR